MAATPDKQDDRGDFGDVLDEVFRSKIGRLVAFALTPLLALAVPPVVDGLNTALGTDFTNRQISDIAIATVVGIALVIWQWLRNRGNWERQVAEIDALYRAGKEEIDRMDDGGGTTLSSGRGPETAGPPRTHFQREGDPANVPPGMQER